MISLFERYQRIHTLGLQNYYYFFNIYRINGRIYVLLSFLLYSKISFNPYNPRYFSKKTSRDNFFSRYILFPPVTTTCPSGLVCRNSAMQPPTSHRIPFITPISMASCVFLPYAFNSCSAFT